MYFPLYSFAPYFGGVGIFLTFIYYLKIEILPNLFYPLRVGKKGVKHSNKSSESYTGSEHNKLGCLNWKNKINLFIKFNFINSDLTNDLNKCPQIIRKIEGKILQINSPNLSIKTINKHKAEALSLAGKCFSRFYSISCSEFTKSLIKTAVLPTRWLGLNNSLTDSDKEYIQQFWVGLLEGDGTITVDKLKNTLRIRFVIALKNLDRNVFMLNLIRDTIGGRIRIERNNRYVVWTASNKKDLVKVFAILAKYPLFSSRKQCQLSFAKRCLINPDIGNFVKNRNEKYLNQSKFVIDPNNFPLYFKGWFSGFVEAEGHFSLIRYPTGKIRKASFSIGQNYDKSLIEMIKNYVGSTHKITEDKPKLVKASFFDNRLAGSIFKEENNFQSNLSGDCTITTHYRVAIYGPKSRSFLFTHFSNYPLLGDKYYSYVNWISAFDNYAELLKSK
nr:LAGLIDADG homing endonuclease [Porodaedalea mongolica]